MKDGAFDNDEWVVEFSKGAYPGYDSDAVTPMCSSGPESDCVRPDDPNPPAPAKGWHFVWFGGIDYRHYQQITNNVTIPSGATHLSLFVAAAAAEGVLPSTTATFIVSVDGDVLLFIDKHVLSQLHDRYENIDVALGKYADDKYHSLTLKFFMEADGDEASVIIDYLRFIRDTNRLLLLRFLM